MVNETKEDIFNEFYSRSSTKQCRFKIKYKNKLKENLTYFTNNVIDIIRENSRVSDKTLITIKSHINYLIDDYVNSVENDEIEELMEEL